MCINNVKLSILVIDWFYLQESPFSECHCLCFLMFEVSCCFQRSKVDFCKLPQGREVHDIQTSENIMNV